MTAYTYDVLYLGSGHGTFDGAIPLAARGVKVGVIEAEKVGGTCPNWGCNAKISLDQPVALQHALHAMNNVVAGSGEIDWAENQAHKHDVIDGLPGAIQGMLEGSGVDMLFGRGTLVDAHTIQVGDDQYTAEKIVISTGLRPHRMDIEGADLFHDSRDFMDLSAMPKHITVIGAGYIGMEFATMARAAGSDVTLLMRGNQALRSYHQDYVEMVLADMAESGINIVREVEVTSAKSVDGAIELTTTKDAIKTDWVLDATGRIPNTDNIGLEAVGVAFNENGIEVNEHLQTSIENIYASGDVLDKTQPKLTPTAVFESKYLMHKFAGDSAEAIDYPVIASNVYTSPRIAQAGVTVAVAKAAPDQYRIVESNVGDDWYRQVSYETGKTTVIFNQDNQIVGVTEVSPRAEDVVNTLLPAIEFGYTGAQLERLVTIFPSISAFAFGLA